MQSEFVNLTTHTHQRAERENDAITMRLRAIRTEVTINGQDSRHGKRITRAAALVFFLVTFSKVKKLPSAGRNPASPRPRRARGGDGIPALSSAPRAMAGRNPASPVPPHGCKKACSRPKALGREQALLRGATQIRRKSSALLSPLYGGICRGRLRPPLGRRHFPVPARRLSACGLPLWSADKRKIIAVSARYTSNLYAKLVKMSTHIRPTAIIYLRRPCCGCNPRPFPPQPTPSTRPTRPQAQGPSSSLSPARQSRRQRPRPTCPSRR
jgi:hypothetical protein